MGLLDTVRTLSSPGSLAFTGTVIVAQYSLKDSQYNGLVYHAPVEVKRNGGAIDVLMPEKEFQLKGTALYGWHQKEKGMYAFQANNETLSIVSVIRAPTLSAVAVSRWVRATIDHYSQEQRRNEELFRNPGRVGLTGIYGATKVQ